MFAHGDPADAVIKTPVLKCFWLAVFIPLFHFAGLFVALPNEQRLSPSRAIPIYSRRLVPVRVPIFGRGKQMPSSRRFPPPWTVEDVGGSFVVKASNDRPLIFIYYREGVGRRSLTRLLTRDVARRIAAGIANLPKLLRKS
jgi:hypothetical protein